jgi:hypothetical protein
MNEIAQVPAPWQLRGNGFVLIYRGLAGKIAPDQMFLPPFLQDQTLYGLGSVMLVDYHKSDAGPYRELLFIPGQHKAPIGRRRSFYSISKIYVSTMASVVNGRRNWAIPKEQAKFAWEADGPRREHIQVGHQGESVLETEISWGRIPLPLTTKFLRLELRQPVLDQDSHHFLLTRLLASGTGYLARLHHWRTNPKLFPELGPIKPLLALRVENFRMTFPVARIQEA